MWVKQDDGAWRNAKLRRAGRAARGLFWDLTSFSGDARSDGFIDVVSLPQLETSPTDPDLKVLIREGLLHKRGDQCRCIDNRGWSWPRGRQGFLIHDHLDYNPSREENEIAKAQRAELRDPALRASVRSRDLSRCRYCARQVNPRDRRGELGETLDHIDPAVAAGADNLVIACRACNSAKKQRTPEQALMVLLTVAEVRAKHFAELGQPDPDLAPITNPIQVGQADGSGRVGSGRVGFGSGAAQLGPAATPRSSGSPNPYLRGGHGDPARDPPPPTPTVNSPPRSTDRRSQRPKKRKGNRR